MSFAIIPRSRALGANRLHSASIFDAFWNDLAGAPRWVAAPRPSRFVPRIDVSETDDAYRVEVELPGVESSNIEVIAEDEVLTLKGEKKRSEEGETEGAGRSESLYGSFERRLRFPHAIPEEGVKAVYKNGVLTVSFPKPVEARPQERLIPVETA